MSGACTVYVAHRDEVTTVWRPVTAEPVGPEMFRLLGPIPEGEVWEFLPGAVVRCENRSLSGKLELVAVERSRA